jgi:xylulokinase
VRGIGLSGQMHGATLLDASDDVLRPCILWNDTRSHAEAAAMDADPVWRRSPATSSFRASPRPSSPG